MSIAGSSAVSLDLNYSFPPSIQLLSKIVETCRDRKLNQIIGYDPVSYSILVYDSTFKRMLLQSRIGCKPEAADTVIFHHNGVESLFCAVLVDQYRLRLMECSNGGCIYDLPLPHPCRVLFTLNSNANTGLCLQTNYGDLYFLANPLANLEYINRPGTKSSKSLCVAAVHEQMGLLCLHSPSDGLIQICSIENKKSNKRNSNAVFPVILPKASYDKSIPLPSSKRLSKDHANSNTSQFAFSPRNSGGKSAANIKHSPRLRLDDSHLSNNNLSTLLGQHLDLDWRRDLMRDSISVSSQVSILKMEDNESNTMELTILAEINVAQYAHPSQSKTQINFSGSTHGIVSSQAY